MKTYLVVITPTWANPLEEPKVPSTGDERHLLEIHFVSTIARYGSGVSIFWVRSDIWGLNLTKLLVKAFKTDKISILEVE